MTHKLTLSPQGWTIATRLGEVTITTRYFDSFGAALDAWVTLSGGR